MPLRLVEGVLALEHSLDYVLVACAVEGRVPTEKDVEDNTTAP